MPLLNDLVAFGEGVVGVGSMAGDDVADIPAVWLSPDLETWTAHAVSTLPADALWGDLPFTEVVVANDVLVAVVTGPGVFTAEDPTDAWTRLDLGTGSCPGHLAADGSTVVTVGAIGACGIGGDTRPAAWHSHDGLAWEPAELTSSGTGGGWFSGVIAVPGGYIGWGRFLEEPICDVGCLVDPETDPFAGAPWTSNDGVTWQRIDRPGPFEDSMVEQVVRSGDAYLALGWRGQAATARRALWRSSDGLAWELETDEIPFLVDPADPANGANTWIAGGSEGFVAWSVRATETATWYSMDGVSWETAEALEGSVTGVREVGGRYVAFGTREEADPGITLPCTKDQVVAGRCRTVGMVWSRD
jgi:hypothetical protein